MDAQEEFVAYVQNHPEFYVVAQAPVYIKVLSALAEKAFSVADLRSRLPAIELSDLELIIKSLLSLKLLGEHHTDERVLYYATAEAKEFLEKYKKTRTVMKV